MNESVSDTDIKKEQKRKKECESVREKEIKKERKGKKE